MKKLAIVIVGIVIGLVLGYSTRSFVAYAVLLQREPMLNWAFISDIGESISFCGQKGLEEQKRDLVLYERNLNLILTKYPNHSETKMYYAFAEAGLSMVESRLNNPKMAAEHMSAAQQRLKELGWRETSPQQIAAVLSHAYPQSELFQMPGKSKPDSPCSGSTSKMR